ncbi:DciA family protein [Rufibacter soli]
MSLRPLNPRTPFMRKADTISIKDSIEAMLKAYKLNGKLSEMQLVSSWEKIMGKAISMKTQEVFVRNRKLYVRLTSAPLKHELNMAKAKVMALINAEVGEQVIDDVVFL